MSREFNAICETTGRHRIDLRVAAYAHAPNRIGQAIEAVGTRSYFKGGR
jgi:glutamate dehydrogenase (NADP+)